MRYIILCVEQLDRAARELHFVNPVNGRLALMLIDNIVELICHRQCQDLIDWDGGEHRLDQPKYSLRQRRRVLGRFFDQKITFLRSEELISEDEQEFMLIAHRYRNEAYHIWLRDDAIISEIAWYYHSLACDLFGRLRPQGVSIMSDDPHSDRVAYHVQKTGLQTPSCFIHDLDILAQSIAAERPVNKTSLGVTLSVTLLTELSEMEEQFEYLVSGNPSGMNGKRILQNIQYHDEFMREMEKCDLFPSDPKYGDEAQRVHARMKQSWRPRHPNIPLTSWRKRAESPGYENSYLKALEKFDDARKDKSYLADIIGEAVVELDMHYS